MRGADGPARAGAAIVHAGDRPAHELTSSRPRDDDHVAEEWRGALGLASEHHHDDPRAGERVQAAGCGDFFGFRVEIATANANEHDDVGHEGRLRELGRDEQPENDVRADATGADRSAGSVDEIEHRAAGFLQWRVAVRVQHRVERRGRADPCRVDVAVRAPLGVAGIRGHARARRVDWAVGVVGGAGRGHTRACVRVEHVARRVDVALATGARGGGADAATTAIPRECNEPSLLSEARRVLHSRGGGCP